MKTRFAQGEEVRGEIIGGDYVQWKLMYEGREQGSGYTESDDDAIAQAKVRRDELKRDCPLTYPGSMWEVRLYP